MIIVDVRSRDGSAIASRCGVTLFDDLLDDDEPGIVVPELISLSIQSNEQFRDK